MKQVLQSLKDGKTEVAEVPRPEIGEDQLLIATDATLVSSGTERMLVDFGKASLVGKARQQPEKLRLVLDKMRTDGIAPTVESVLNKLDQPLPLGYCNVGTVLECGSRVSEFNVGDRVVSNGAHAEIVACSPNLCAKIPDDVSDEAAAFTVLGAIALQGIRLADPTLGESVVVFGLGLIGLISVQLLRANGCRVLALDVNSERLELARQFGVEVADAANFQEVSSVAKTMSRGRGVDAVLITAATSSNDLIHQAATLCRKRGRIVLVGTAGLQLSRADFYEKELSFQVSCSYGPGRYDPNYEEKGFDYPVGFVRWTEKRNFEAVLDTLENGSLAVTPLISHRFTIDQAASAYELMLSDRPNLGLLLSYPNSANAAATRAISVAGGSAASTSSAATGSVSLAFIGAGNYATAALIPAFGATGAVLKSIASRGGVSGLHAARRFGFDTATTDVDGVFSDPDIHLLVICTRHDTHAELVSRGLKSGKSVFVEKPLAMSHSEIEMIEQALSCAGDGDTKPVLMVGFNRRFAPHIVKMKALLSESRAPKTMVMTVNAGPVPSDHWTLDPSVGGGRIIGEACHFVDLLRFLAGAPIEKLAAWPMAAASDPGASLALTFANGSSGVVHYVTNGSKAFPKERLEIFCNGGVLQLDNFRVLRGFGWPGFRTLRLWRQDKGQGACAQAMIDACEAGGTAPIPAAEIFEVARASVSLSEAIKV